MAVPAVCTGRAAKANVRDKRHPKGGGAGQGLAGLAGHGSRPNPFYRLSLVVPLWGGGGS